MKLRDPQFSRVVLQRTEQFVSQWWYYVSYYPKEEMFLEFFNVSSNSMSNSLVKLGEEIPKILSRESANFGTNLPIILRRRKFLEFFTQRTQIMELCDPQFYRGGSSPYPFIKRKTMG